MVMQIKKLRMDLGMTQLQLAERMGVVQHAVSQWEHEVFLPQTRQLPLLAKALCCSISDLFLPENIE